MPETPTRRRLDQPLGTRRLRLEFDTETFGRYAESLARFLGTGTYLLWQTVIVIVWIVLNVIGIIGRWDPYPFILLNLAFSTQAAYAAPLILLAQNRQDDRDRVSLEEDRARAQRTIADTEYLSREIAGIRLAVGEMVTRDFLRGELNGAGGTTGRGHERGGAERGAVDKETQKALTRAVDKAVDRAVERALDRSMERAIDKAVESAVDRAMERHPARGVGHDTNGTGVAAHAARGGDDEST